MTTQPSATPVVPEEPGRGTPLQVAEQAFQLLVNGPEPLSVDGKLVGHGMPQRLVPLDELRAVLLHPATGREARDATWRLLVTRARTRGPAWVVGAVGVAMPALRTASARLYRDTGHADTQAELLASFLAALRDVDLGLGRVCSRICNSAFVAARAVVRAEDAARAGRVDTGVGSVRPPVPWGHPDLVLARAVAARVITPREAAVIGATRLEQVSLDQYAVRIESTYEAVKRCRARGERRLVTAIQDGVLVDTDTDADVIREATLIFQVDPNELHH